MDSSSSSQVIWPIYGGCLDGVVTCESSISAALDDSDPPPLPSTPLILRRPSTGSAPCEITIHFTQLHEIKQIYVKSTARVYEIYYEPHHNAGNEYLCTVRCGFAATDTSLSAASPVSSSTNEDGWVNVKIHDSSKLHTADTSSPSEEDSAMLPDIRDRFEATAEITDADPVFSVTLRLLSIQSGDYVLVDEVYVFADPVESVDDQPATVPSLESSSGGALLSMFIPTLMQLSSSRASKLREHHGSDVSQTSVNQDIEQLSTAPALLSTNTFKVETIASTVPNVGQTSGNQDIEQRSIAAALMSTNTFKVETIPNTVPNGAPHSQTQLEPATKTSNLLNSSQLMYGEKDSASSMILQTLHELVSRVSGIEDFCLRFEENMLKPITMMEKRLETVESQVDSIFKNSQFPNTGCTKYSAPEFSCNISESNSVNTGGNGHPPEMMKSEPSEKDDGCGEDLCMPTKDAFSCANVQCHDVQTLACDSKVLPGLLVTAPDFPFSDDEEENDLVEAVKDPSNVSLARPVSIDTALASALAGFVSSASINPVRFFEMVEEAETVSVLKGSDGSPTSPSASSVSSTRPLEFSEIGSENLSAIEGGGNIFLSASIHSGEHRHSSALAPPARNKPCTDFFIAEKETSGAANYGATEACDVNAHVVSGGVIKKSLVSSDSSSVDGLGIMNQISEPGSTKPNEDEGDSDFRDSSTNDSRSPTEDLVDSALEAPRANIESSSREGVESKCCVLLRDIIELPKPGIVDFSAPLLDVKFSSLDYTSSKPSLETLLVDTPNHGCTDVCARDNFSNPGNELDDFLGIEDDSSGVPETLYSEVLLFDYCKSPYMLSEMELQDGPDINNQEMCGSLI